MTTGSGARPVRVVLQQRHELFRSGLALLLGASPAVEVVGSVRTAEQLVDLCVRARPLPHVALVDASADCAELAATSAALRMRRPRLRLIALNPHGTRRLPPRGSFDAVVDRVGGVAAIVASLIDLDGGESPTGPGATDPAVLSKREIQVLALLGGGSTVRNISDRLAIRPRTVEHHKQRIFDKLGVQNQAHAVAVALCSGLLPTTPSAGVP